jgi:uncharacterized protein
LTLSRRRARVATRVAAALAWALLLAPETARGTDPAAEAYRRGDHAGAFAGWYARAQAGDATARFNAAILLDQGRGVGRDRAAAAALYLRAAEQGDARAAFNLAQMLADGDGVARDAAAAARWFGAAALTGDALAQFALGALLAAGAPGLAADPGAAIGWFARAAAQDHPQALARLAMAHANGIGTPRDLAEATRFQERADIAAMTGESETSCTTQRSAARLAECRRAVPRF